jgi:hypothetical protein
MELATALALIETALAAYKTLGGNGRYAEELEAVKQSGVLSDALALLRDLYLEAAALTNEARRLALAADHNPALRKDSHA